MNIKQILIIITDFLAIIAFTIQEVITCSMYMQVRLVGKQLWLLMLAV